MGMDVNSEDAADWSRLMKENSRLEHECARLRAEVERLTAACEGLLIEWDKLSRYGSPMAKTANERIALARTALAARHGL